MKRYILFLLPVTLFLPMMSCKKLVSIPNPDDKITSTQLFETDKGALSAMAGVYANLVGGTESMGDANSQFAAGLSTLMGGMSSDELVQLFPFDAYSYNTNHVTYSNYSSNPLWMSAYSAIYAANAVIDGIRSSRSTGLHDSLRTRLTAEAKCIRAFCYFYLVNFFGDVPLVLSPEPVKQGNLARQSTVQVYQQMTKDLQEAAAALPADYSISGGKRIRVTKWAATALLARVYLYNKDYANAFIQSSAIIDKSDLFDVPHDLNSLFSTASTEAIWQLQQNVNHFTMGSATPEGYAFIPSPPGFGLSSYYLSPQLLSAFEAGDARWTAWVDSTAFSLTGDPPSWYYYPNKYKTGSYNAVIGGAPTEYYVVLRLAEQYLIRAEAEANGAGGGRAAAITDLNVLRSRAGVPDLDPTLPEADVPAAVAHERQVELFAEWGHRWFDLKRTGRAVQVLSQIPLKQPWAGEHQLLYPIPQDELKKDPNLQQNPGY